jgi:hypothetical protein
MAGRQRCEVPRDLARGAERFVRWRRNRVRGERIPDALWNCAVDLAGRYGVSRTAAVLRVGYYELQKQVARCHESVPAAAPAAFVELPRAASARECVIEFESASGSRMRVQFQGELPDLVALGRSFWDAG